MTDTVAHTGEEYLIESAAVVGPRRRWVTISDHAKVHLYWSDGPAAWREADIGLPYGYAVGVASLDDTTTLVAWTNPSGMWCGILRGEQWTPTGLIIGRYPYRVRLRSRPSGGQWVAGATAEPHIEVKRYLDGTWSAPESLIAPYRSPRRGAITMDVDLSRDGGEYPAVAWDYQNYYTGEEGVCACVPTDSGFGACDDLGGNGGLPMIARDRNGDVWVAWWGYGITASWLHTYTRATASTPVVMGAGRNRVVAWQLSEPAPETWWAVLRARDEGEFEPVARVRAGASAAMSWRDGSPPRGVLRYRIRRESVDKRYEWVSGIAQWPRKCRKPLPLTLVSAAGSSRIELSLEGAVVGLVELQVYDLQGRSVMRQDVTVRGASQERLSLDLSSSDRRLPAGVYFARVKDISGAESNAVKLVVLR